jgi:hypothetical protein
VNQNLAVTVEIGSIDRSPSPAGILGFAIDGPTPGDRPDGDGFEVDGWVLGRVGPVTDVEIVFGDEVRCRVPVARERPDVALAFPERPWAAGAGFRGWVPSVGLPSSFSLTIRALLPSGDRVLLAKLGGDRVADLSLEGDGDAPEWPGPDFIVLGAQRAGSTSLYRYIIQHPLVAPATVKEVKYFSYFHRRPRGWYRRQFPDSLPPGGQTGEATPYYLFHPHAARRIRERAPHARLIVVLRNPVDRAYSHYFHERRRGTETLSFEDALAHEAGRLAGEEERMRSDEDYNSLAHQLHSYQRRGQYADQLRSWYELVPRDRLLVLRSEDLYADPSTTIDVVTSFLGLPEAPLAEAVPHNEGIYPPMRPETRRSLERAFERSNHDLRALLGERFGWDA